MKQLRKTMLTMLLLLMGVQGAWAVHVTYNKPYFTYMYDAKGTVEDSESFTDDAIELTGEHPNEWIALGSDDFNEQFYVVKGKVSCQTLAIFGRVHLILADNSELTCTGGVKVELQNKYAQLYIYSQGSSDNEGKLVVTNSYKNAAGIGSSEGQRSGLITIYGGVIDVTGGAYAAGIGGGACTSGAGVYVDDIVVYGGRITSRGGKGGAGIGAGSSYASLTSHRGHGGKITFYGGTVTAIGGELAAGLGGGGGYSPIFSSSNELGGDGGEVHVYGGNLTAQGGSEGAGIGGGNRGEGGKVYVYGGTVNATGGSKGAGIGGGNTAKGAEVHVSGGQVEAKGGKDASGIGTGAGSNDSGKHDRDGGSLEVTGGNVTAIGSEYGAGIGGGYRQKGANVTITGGTVIACAGEDADARNESGGSAIGSGRYPSYVKAKENARALKLGDNYMVTAGDAADKLEHVADAASRVATCRWRRYARVEVCHHTPQSGDAVNVANTYTILDDTYHEMYCLYCGAVIKDVHNLEEACVCGFKGEVAIDTWKMSIYDTTDGKTYAEAKPKKVIRGREYVLPQPAAPDGLIFMGYFKAEAAPEGIEMKDSEIRDLVEAGTIIKPEADANYYARYRYDYTEEWTWAKDYSSATVNVTWANGDAKLENLKATVYYDTKEPKGDVAGYQNYTATYAYQKAEGITYNFTNNIFIPYINSLSLANDSYNDQIIADNSGSLVKTLILSGRTFYKDGYWNTLCLPFAVENFAGTPLEGATVMELDAEKSALGKDGVLTLNFKEVTSFEAGKPYIVKWPKGTDLVNPVFKNVTIAYKLHFVSFGNETDSPCVFIAHYSPLHIIKSTLDYGLFLGKENSLGYSHAPRVLGSCRCYFMVPPVADAPAVRGFKVYFDGDEATGIFNVAAEISIADGAYYDLQGRKLEGKPTRKGLYIQNGRVIVIK